MRSKDQCLAKVAEMDRQARNCSVPTCHDSYAMLADGWRSMNVQADWQDALELLRAAAFSREGGRNICPLPLTHSSEISRKSTGSPSYRCRSSGSIH
jgi:hypothetical protein